MKMKSSRKTGVRILGILMSGILLAGILGPAAPPVYAAAELTPDDFTYEKVYKENKKIYEKRSTTDTALGYYLQPYEVYPENEQKVKETAQKIVDKNDSDYVKLQKVHDWVADNIYYDFDISNGTAIWEDPNVGPGDVVLFALEKRRGVCGYYAALTSELLRSLGIPTITVSGPVAQGNNWENPASEPHAWNEAYVDGRWIILDTTWDSQNAYWDGKYQVTKPSVRTCFDMTLEEFSKSHKIMPDNSAFWMEQQFNRELYISNIYFTLRKGKTKQLSIKRAGKYKYINLKDAKITYSSSNKKVATVSKKGKVKAKKAGSAVITTKVKLEGITLKFKTNVNVI